MARLWRKGEGLLRRTTEASSALLAWRMIQTAGYHRTIQTVPRELTGRRAAAKERRAGRVPAVVLTRKENGLASNKILVTADEKQIREILKQYPFFCSTPMKLQVRAGAGSSVVLQSGTVLPIKVHKDEETGRILNLVMEWAEEGTELKVDVPVVFKGEDVCPGLKKGGYLQKIRTSLKYICPTEHIPPKIEVDLTNLDIGDRVLMHDVEVHPSLKLLSKNETMPICKILESKPAEKELKTNSGDKESPELATA